jgi:arylsulfatase A-like enzyme
VYATRRQFLLQAVSALGAAPARPNLLLLVADQWSESALARLADEGVRFDRAYTACPQSSPSRAALLTGRFPHACGVTRNGMPLPLDEKCIAEPFKAAGYATGCIGKWELGAEGPRRRGFDYWAAADPRNDLASEFIRQHRGQPFFLFLACQTRAAVDALDAAGLAADTIVMSIADYGPMPGSVYERSARIPLFARYPRWLAAGETSDMPVSNIDCMPTLLGLCGIEIPDGVQGRDLSTLWLGGKGTRPESVYCEGGMGQPDEWRMVVRGLDKLVVNARGEITHLFNLGQDPDEVSNLVNDRATRLLQDELQALLRDWARRTGDRMSASGLRKRG